MDIANKDVQAQNDKILAAKTVRIERAHNGYIVKRIDGHFVYVDLKSAFESIDLYFKSQEHLKQGGSRQ